MRDRPSYPLSVLVAIDQLGNALTGGHPQATISERVGCLAKHARNARAYWQLLERLIDFTFYPVDGPRHCYRTWRLRRGILHRGGNLSMQLVLSVLIIAVCLPLSLILRVAVMLVPSWRFKTPFQLPYKTTVRRTISVSGDQVTGFEEGPVEFTAQPRAIN